MRISDWSSDVCSSDLCDLLDERIDPEALWLAPGRPEQAGLSLAVACTFMQNRIPDIWTEGRFARLQAFCAEAAELEGFRRWPHASMSKPLAQAPSTEGHTSELQSLMRISYAVFTL